MGVNKSKKLSFIHIPKTAGISIQKALDITPSKEHYTWGHYHSLHPNHFIFSFVRNPYDRFVSSVFYIQQICNLVRGENTNKPLPKLHHTLKDLSFSEVLSLLESNPKIFNHKAFSYQGEYIFDEGGVSRCDYIGKFESLNEDLKSIATIVGIDYSEIEHHNKSNRKSWEHYLPTKSEMKVVYTHYKKDFYLLGYPKCY